MSQLPGTFQQAYPGSIYQSQVQNAQTDYSTVMNGYANTLNSQQANYGALQGQVANTLGMGGTPWGVAQPAAMSIADQYASQMGQSQQGLINSGLGNSTVLQSVQRGIGLDAAKAYSGLGAQLAQTYAGYQSQLGLAQLGAQNQTMAQESAYQGAYHNAGYSLVPPAQRMGGGAIGSPGGGNSSLGKGYGPSNNVQPAPGSTGPAYQGAGYTPPPWGAGPQVPGYDGSQANWAGNDYVPTGGGGSPQLPNTDLMNPQSPMYASGNTDFSGDDSYG